MNKNYLSFNCSFVGRWLLRTFLRWVSAATGWAGSGTLVDEVPVATQKLVVN